MRKIPTLFVRDPDDMRRVLPEVHPDCGWVLAGEGVATRKYDGTCVMLDDAGEWWARREVKPGKQPPAGWVEVDHDETTGKRVGWEPIEQSAFARWHAEALTHGDGPTVPGTYELCGPKINGNPEKWTSHFLIRHAAAQMFPPLDEYLKTAAGSTVVEIRDYLAILLDTIHGPGGDLPVIEGVVWHHPDGRMAKLKARDLR
jgi:hypothetical protein